MSRETLPALGHDRLAASLGVGVAVVDAQGRQRYVNPAFCRMVGWPAEELVGEEPPFVYWPPEDHAELRRALERTVAGAAPPEGWDLRFMRRDGTRFDVRVTVTPLDSPDGGWIAAVADTTEQRKGERRLRLQAQLLDTVGQAVIATDAAGCVTYWNREAERLYGWTHDEVMGRDILEVNVGPSDRKAAAERLDRLGRGEPWTGQFVVRRRDGGSFPAYVNNTPVRDEAGVIIGVIGVSWDISERLLAETELADRETRLRLALEAGRLGTWEWDIGAGRVSWSPMLERIHGLPEGTFEGTLEAYQRDIHPDDREHVLSTIDRSARGGVDHKLEYRIITPDGTVRWLEAHGQVARDAEGRPARLVGVCTDISERKAAEYAQREEALLVEMVEQIGRSLASELELGPIVQEVLDAAVSLTRAQFGVFYHVVAPGEESRHDSFLSLDDGIAPDAGFPIPSDSALIRATLSGAQVALSADLTSDPSYASLVPAHAARLVRSYLAVPVISREGAVLGGLFFCHEDANVFDERDERLLAGVASWAAVAMDNARLYEAEQHARAAAELANRAKSDFLATMSHELRTPLNAMLGYVDLLLAGIPDPIPEQPRKKVERIGVSARHLLGLIEEILSFSRLEAGEERVEPHDVDLKEVVEEVCALLEPIALAKNIAFDCPLPDPQRVIHTDARKIRQILVNLLSNAVKFTDQGAVSLRIEDAGPDIVFHVIDTGCGIPAGQQERVFEPFWQAEGGATRTAGGTGLGLSVTRRLTRLLGGEVSLESEVGRGTRFSVHIPAAYRPTKPMR